MPIIIMVLSMVATLLLGLTIAFDISQRQHFKGNDAPFYEWVITSPWLLALTISMSAIWLIITPSLGNSSSNTFTVPMFLMMATVVAQFHCVYYWITQTAYQS